MFTVFALAKSVPLTDEQRERLMHYVSRYAKTRNGLWLNDFEFRAIKLEWCYAMKPADGVFCRQARTSRRAGAPAAPVIPISTVRAFCSRKGTIRFSFLSENKPGNVLATFPGLLFPVSVLWDRRAGTEALRLIRFVLFADGLEQRGIRPRFFGLVDHGA